MKYFRPSGERGLTFVEIMAAVVILGMIVPVIVLFSTSHIRANADNGKQIQATALATAIAELIKKPNRGINSTITLTQRVTDNNAAVTCINQSIPVPSSGPAGGYTAITSSSACPESAGFEYRIENRTQNNQSFHDMEVRVQYTLSGKTKSYSVQFLHPKE